MPPHQDLNQQSSRLEPDEATLVLSENYIMYSGGLIERSKGPSIEPEVEDGIASLEAFDGILTEAASRGADIKRDRHSSPMHIDHFDGSDATHVLVHVSLVFGGGKAFVDFLKFAQPLVLQWLKNRGGRSITIKANGNSIRVTGVNDLSQAVAAIERLSQGAIPPDSTRKAAKGSSIEER
ncbi:MAG TPA: hypothetical protein VF006_06405 [Longimicrobium sp.]